MPPLGVAWPQRGSCLKIIETIVTAVIIVVVANEKHSEFVQA